MLLYRSIVIYFIIVLVYFRFRDIERNKTEKFIFSMFIPIFGFITVVLSERVQAKPKEEKKIEKKNLEKDKNKEYLTNIQSSLVDDLAVNDYESAREMILSVKSLNLEEQCKIYHIAIKSKNIEISHIAAVSLMRIQNYFEKLFAHMELKADLTKTEDLKKYIKGIHKYLKCKLIQGALYKKYVNDLINLIEKLIEIEPKCEEEYYTILVESCIKNKEYKKALNYLQEEIDVYGMKEKLYELAIKICVKTKDIESLNDLLKKIEENSNDSEKLNAILEFWK